MRMRQRVAPAPTVLVEEPCEFEIKDGLVYARYPGAGVVLAFRRHVFFANFRRAALCMQECHGAEAAEVIPFPVPAAHS